MLSFINLRFLFAVGNTYLSFLGGNYSIECFSWLTLHWLFLSLSIKVPVHILSYYTKILSPSCDKTFDTCPESQLLEWKLNGFSSIFHTNSQHCACPFIQERYPYLHRPSSIFDKWCHCLFSLVHKRLLTKPLCHRRRNTVP